MSFTPTGGGAERLCELVRRSLLQGEGLPFADALTAEQMQQAFDEEGVSFGRDDHDANVASARAASDDDGIVYTPAMLLSAMLLSALLTGVQRSCRAAVQRVAVYYALVGREVSSTNTGAYCLARAKVTAGVASRCGVRRPFPTTGGGTASVRWSWTARCSRCPTPSRTRQSILSPPARPRGLGFPILRAVALTPLATGLVLALATGLCAGKEAGETALPRTLFDQLQRGDLVLADRCYGGWFLLALLRALGVEFVTRLHQHRTADFTRGRRLSQGDHRVAWPRPQKPEWLDQE